MFYISKVFYFFECMFTRYAFCFLAIATDYVVVFFIAQVVEAFFINFFFRDNSNFFE